MYKILRIFLFMFSDPEIPHTLALKTLRVFSKFKPLISLVSKFTIVDDDRLKQNVFGIDFKNPVGVAAGMDKNGEAILGLESLGFGSIEVGTISRYPQDGNPRQRLFRLIKDKAIINRMGFNSVGSEKVRDTLKNVTPKNPIGISIGKSKITPLTEAPGDYIASFNTLYEYADYFAINVSSPNTPGLRELQEKKALEELLQKLQIENVKNAEKFNIKRKPILVKIAPDLTFPAIKEILDVCKDNNIDGIIAVNTTLERKGLETEINEVGGLSGLPLKDRATEIISFIHREAPDLPIIGVGGIFTAKDAYEKIKAGASLIQIYTGLVYEGPFIAKTINKGLLTLLEKDGIGHLSDIHKRSC